MSKKTKMRLFSILLSLMMLVSICPTNVYAWDEEIDCDFCGAFCGDSYICDGGSHCSEESGRDCYQENHCQDCGECKSNVSEWCDDCHMCVSCASENGCHCIVCGVCQVDSELCTDCWKCYDCGGECSEGEEHVCLECHLELDFACPGCGFCYVEDDTFRCQACGYCAVCEDDWCDDCHMGIECAMDNGCHCVSCGACQVDSELCSECWQCYDCAGECSEGTDHVCLECHLSLDFACPGCGLCYVEDETLRCLICGYCAACETEWCADCHMGIECAMDNGCHCIECGVCQVESKLCENCWRCYDCGGTCSEGDDHNCLECHIENGEACPTCESCFIDKYGTSCERCGVCFDCCTDWCDMCNLCYECGVEDGLHCQSCAECLLMADGYCTGCLICSDCSSGICESCEACADCVEICPNCEEHCNDCAEVCGECGSCEYCTDLNYCDMCNEYYCYDCRVICNGCGSCDSCVNVCISCGDYCSGCASVCTECGECEFCVSLCETCEEYCSDCYEQCPNCEKIIAQKVDLVELTVTTPREGNKPSYTVGLGRDAYYAMGGSSNYTDYRQWMESVDGVNYTVMSTSDTFKSGYYYKVYIDISAASGYTFLVYDNGVSIQPNVSATVNGSNAKVHKMFDQVPSKYITVEYDFGACNDSVIERIEVIDVDKPIAGATPDYFANVFGTGYHVDKSNYDNYHFNGITWYDTTEEENTFVMYKDSKFIAGHKYTAIIKVATDQDYEFYTDKNGEVLATCYVNGYPAQFGVTSSGYQWNQKIEYTFTCEKAKISEVTIENLESPIAGNNPDFTANTDDSFLYILDSSYGINGIYWYDADDNLLLEDDKFVEGEKYRVEIKLIPNKNDGIDASEFMEKIGANVGGIEAVAAYAMSNKAYVYFDFICEPNKEIVNKKGWVKEDNNWYYYDANGVMQTSKWIGSYYVKADGVMAVSEFVDDGKYYVDENGLWVKATKWLQIGDNWYFLNAGTVQISKWAKIGGKYYYFDGAGVMQSSKWILGKYYVKSNGVMATSELVDGGKYYVDENGLWVKDTKWLQIGDNWYFLNAGTVQMSKWTKISGKYYYFDETGIMQTSKWIGNYYVKSNGIMAVSEFVDGGKYYVDENGLWVKETKWMKIGNNWYYINKGTVQISKWSKIAGKYYYFDETGIMQTSKWIGNYYVKADGSMAVSQWVEGKYYVKADGTMAKSEWVDNGRYYVGEDGVWIKNP